MARKDIKINLSDIPKEPGVYMFIDAKGRILYVGKAKSLRNRLASYLNQGAKTIKTEKMLSHAVDVKTIVTENEVEAFLLEANLIKTEMPKYNILLKDSKGYPYVMLTNEEYPRLVYTRNISDDKAIYFGPFVNVGDLKQMIELLRSSFPLRTCSNHKFKEGRICLKYQIKKCYGPCENFISKKDYLDIALSVRKFFKGETDEVEALLQQQMEKYSKNLQFEEAGNIRDRLYSIKRLFSKQSVTNIIDDRSIDVFYMHNIASVMGITQIFIRGGKMIGVTTRFFTDGEDELLEAFIMQFYANVRQFPELLAIGGGEYSELLELALSKMAGRSVHIRKRGITGIMDIAKKNAEEQTELYLRKVGERRDVSERLSQLIGAEDIKRVECVDISHLGGEHTVGVSVTAINGEFSKQNYRKYKIKSAGNDDFQSMYELFTRKGENIKDGSEQEADLYIIDGGLGQLSSTLRAAEEAGFKANFISISKSRPMRAIKHLQEDTIEHIHLPNRKNPVILRKNDALLHFIQRMRDEAHRFAITYSRSLALKRMSKSPLLEIEGLGEKRLKDLLQAFPDIHNRKDITVEELKEVAKLPENVAINICNYLREN